MGKNIRKIKKLEPEKITVSVSEAIDAYLSCAHVRGLRPATQTEYKSELPVFGKWCESHTIISNRASRIWRVDECSGDAAPIFLDDINAEVVFAYLEYLKQVYKPSKVGKTEISSSTLAGAVKVIKTFLNWCVLDDYYCEYVKMITVQRISKPAIQETIIEAFTAEQIAALFEACQKEESEHLQMRDRAILSVLLDSGLRATELCTLTIGNVCLDPKDSYVKVLGKGGKWGEVGLGEQARRNLQKYIRMFREPTIEYEIKTEQGKLPEREMKKLVQQRLQTSVVFCNRNGDTLTKSGLWRMVDRLRIWAHIEGVRCSPHTFRHTFATMFIRNGGDIYKLSKLLRHSSIKVTEEYLKSLKQSEARVGAKSVLDNL